MESRHWVPHSGRVELRIASAPSNRILYSSIYEHYRIPISILKTQSLEITRNVIFSDLLTNLLNRRKYCFGFLVNNGA